MQIVKGVHFLNITFLLVLFTGIAAAAVVGTVIVVLTCMYVCMYHYSQMNLTLSFGVSNLMLLL